MGQTKPAAGLKSLNRAADTLSTLLAQEVKELNERQKAARRENTPTIAARVGAGHSPPATLPQTLCSRYAAGRTCPAPTGRL